MKLFSHPAFLQHDTGAHPENRSRLDAFPKVAYEDLSDEVLSFVMTVHQKDYVQKVRETGKVHNSRLDQDTIVGPGSYQAALLGVSASMLAAERQDFALARPPGHHAYPNRASGFCLFNNIAIAVENARKNGKKVMIIDFDGHLGDGTSHIFYHTSEVLFFSLHQYPAFPGTGQCHEMGEGKGRGYTINIPLPPGSGDDIFMHALHAYLPVVEQFAPDLIAISAGFDGHLLDPLLQLGLSYGSFYQVGKLIASFSLPAFAVLEGGYNTEVLPKCVYCFLAGINSEDLPYEEAATTSNRSTWEVYEHTLHQGLGLLSPYWKL